MCNLVVLDCILYQLGCIIYHKQRDCDVDQDF
jgi:hypothetical protein